MKLKPNVYIDALALVPANKSGVGYLLDQTLLNLFEDKQFLNEFTVYLVVPLGKAKYLNKYTTRSAVRTKTIWLPARVFSVMLKLNLVPPVDWILGSGIYVFPNYRNWPLYKSRSITYIHDAAFLRYPHMVQPKNQRYLQRNMHRWLTRADNIVTISNFSLKEINNLLHVPYSKIKVIYCGVDNKLFYKRTQREVQGVKEKYDIFCDNYFLYVGNIEPRKNLATLLEAYQLLPKDITDKYGLVVIGGDGWLNEEFHELLSALVEKGLNIIKVQKYVFTEDLPAVYSGARLLIHPAYYEGFGLTPLEALACGTPVVASDIPVLHETLGESVSYFDPTNPVSLQETIINSLKTHPKENNKLLLSDFTWRRAAIELIALIESDFNIGSQPHPLIKRLRTVFSISDTFIRGLLGEKDLKPYNPSPEVTTPESLKSILIKDFIAEQPNVFQALGLRFYLNLKHLIAVPIKKVYRVVRLSS